MTRDVEDVAPAIIVIVEETGAHVLRDLDICHVRNLVEKEAQSTITGMSLSSPRSEKSITPEAYSAAFGQNQPTRKMSAGQ